MATSGFIDEHVKGFISCSFDRLVIMYLACILTKIRVMELAVRIFSFYRGLCLYRNTGYFKKFVDKQNQKDMFLLLQNIVFQGVGIVAKPSLGVSTPHYWSTWDRPFSTFRLGSCEYTCMTRDSDLRAWVPAMYLGDLDGVPGSCSWLVFLAWLSPGYCRHFGGCTTG